MTIEAGAVAALGLGMFASGFALGIMAYKALYHDFKRREEERAGRLVALRVQEAMRREAKRRDYQTRLKAVLGDETSPEHDQMVSEEVEKILGQGPTGRGNGNG